MADVKMPQLGESVTEGTLGKWLKQVGEPVAKYEPLVEVVTDKVTAEVPSDFEGVLTEILVEEGATVKVGTVMCRIAVAGEAAPTTASGATAPPTTVAEPSAVPAPAETIAAREPQQGTDRPAGRYSPAVLKIAQERGVDLSLVTGTGEGGRITRKDVLAFAEQPLPAKGPTTPPTVPVAAVAEPAGVAPTAPQRSVGMTAASGQSAGDVEIVEPDAIRKVIARRMLESKQTAPHAWTMVEADVSKLVAFRAAQKDQFKRREGVDLTFLPFFIKAVSEALKSYPMLNASWIGDKIHLHKRIHISIAVATDDALQVPVIRDADRLSIAGIAHAVNDLAARARSGRLSLDDVQGGTFTVNNTGAFGSVLSQPIINAPQAAILSVESIVKRPVVVGDAIAIRSMVNLCLSLDHRLLDGWVSGQFMKAVKERMEGFGSDTMLY